MSDRVLNDAVKDASRDAVAAIMAIARHAVAAARRRGVVEWGLYMEAKRVIDQYALDSRTRERCVAAITQELDL